MVVLAITNVLSNLGLHFLFHPDSLPGLCSHLSCFERDYLQLSCGQCFERKLARPRCRKDSSSFLILFH